ncbi:ATP-dependent RNA helicase vasa isoform X1 [Apis mellifera]|uniref:RNA helicase n=1 Tax=Apis mellifera TaxID=7460 RepID=A0A7M7GZR6_APIME|nr:ATP-dependent RNA helicase vasa isoform X1 [Apis mellifera]|eukprot:XP_006571765.2 ATP-dependent RNA helicase vasa isoform X1 [Apis mellifera]
MADDWGKTVSYTNKKDESYFDEGGRSYGKGRGFIIQNNNNDDWSVGKKNSNSGTINESEFNDENYWQCNDKKTDIEETGRGKGRGHGKGGSRGRGGNRGRTGFNNKNKDGDDNNDYEDNDYGNQDNRNDRRKKTFAAREDNDEEEAQKPKEQYIPPELPNDEKSLFENGVEIGINFDKYDNIQVNVSGDNVPQPIESFEAAGLRNIVLDNIKKSGYKKPTPVQKHALPIIMNGRDLMACAQTGSGKTAAFAVPIINTLLERSVDLVVTSTYCEPQVVIVSPTRELTIQIWQQIVKFSLNSILKTVVTYGGTSVMHQRGKLSAGCHILVATPGRLLDFVEKGRVKFSSVQFLVLDEADRMLDMGFLPSIEKMVDHETMVPLGERQTLMFSATFPDEVQHLARRFLNNYLFLAVGIVGGACSDVEQNFYEVARNKKKDLLKEILERENDSGTLGGTLVFVEMKKKADFIAVFLSENNYPTTSIHGDRLQRQREEALADFKSGRMSILVATAVAARGLDIKNVSHVINYDLPKGIDEYVHRIGRTGRVGNRGRATSFFDPEEDAPLRGDLVRILKQANQSVPDWMMGGNANRNFMPGRGISKFGGEDVRESEAFAEEYTEEAYSVAQEPEEEW